VSWNSGKREENFSTNPGKPKKKVKRKK